MPYILVTGSLRATSSSSSSSSRAANPTFYVDVSGLKSKKAFLNTPHSLLKSRIIFLAKELSELKNFSPSGNPDSYTFRFPHHACVLLNALEVLGFEVVSSTTMADDADSVIWTMRKEFA